MNHFVNFGLLFCFLTLAVSGIMSFVLPFEIETARVHIIFGVFTLILVGFHLYTKVKYFKKQFKLKGKFLAICFVAWLLILFAAVENWWPVKKVIETGYESRHQAEIVRPHKLVASLQEKGQHSTARKIESGKTALSIHLALTDESKPMPAIAIWSEAKNGTIVETLFLNEELMFSDKPNWYGKVLPRHHIIPIWRHRFTAIAGVDPEGKVDVATGATEKHKFSLDTHLKTDGEPFTIFVEINAPNDPNKSYADEHIGQPSILYSVYIDPKEPQKYYIVELTGHGGDGKVDGGIHYDTESLTTAKDILDLVLIKLSF